MIEPRLSPAQPARPRALTGRRAPLLWLAAWLLLALAVSGPVVVLNPGAWAGGPVADRAAGPDPGLAQAQPPTRPFPRIGSGQHTAPIRRIGVDAQGRWLVTASHDKTARVWDLGSGALLRVLRPPIGQAHEGKLFAAAMSPDGATVAVGGWTKSGSTSGHTIYLFDRDSGRLRHRIGGLPNVVKHLAFSPDGSRLAAALGAGAGIRLYSGGDWTEIGRDPDYGSQSNGIAFDRQGRIAATEFGDGRPGRLHLYGPDLRPIARVETPGRPRPFGVAFSPDGGRIAVGYAESTTVWLFSGDDLKALPGPDTSGIDNGDLSKVAWSRDGRTLFAGGRFQGPNGHEILAWPDAGIGLPSRHRLSTSTIMDLVPLPDGRLVFGAQDPAWGVWRVPAVQGSAGADRPGAGPALATPPGAGPGPAPGRGPAILDFRRVGHVLRLSTDGLVADVDCTVLDSNARWRSHRLRLDLTQRRLTLDPPSADAGPEAIQRRLAALGLDPGAIDGRLGRRTRQAITAFQRERRLPQTGEPDPPTRLALGLPDLSAPETRVRGLTVTDFWDSLVPKLNGKPLDLEPLEGSWSADIAPDGSPVLLGTEWYLRTYAADGTPSWQTPAPSSTFMVNLSDNGRWAVAAFTDGSIRWFEAATGRERLALFVDGAAIAARDLVAAPGTSPEPAPGKQPGEDWQPPGSSGPPTASTSPAAAVSA